MMNFKKIHPIDVHMADDGVVKAIGIEGVAMEMKTSTVLKLFNSQTELVD